jgi:hypothetical protein
MGCATHVCADTAAHADAARLEALALAALVERPASRTVPADELVAAAAAATPTFART